MNRKIIFFCGLIFISLIILFDQKKTFKKRVCIIQLVEHPALNATVKGIIDEIADQGFGSDNGCEIVVESAQGNIGLLNQIASKFASQSPDVVVGVATLSAQSFLKYTKNNNIPLVFSSVTDPKGASLVDEKREYCMYGVSNFVPLEPQLELMKKIQPSLSKLGIIYNPSELNSVSIVTQLQQVAPRYGIELLPQVLTNTADAMQVATRLAHIVDALFISNDSTALSALSTLIAVTNKFKIPTYVSDTDAVQLGAVAALGPNQYQVGRQTGKMVAKILKKETIEERIEYPTQVESYLNLDAANSIGMHVESYLIQQSTVVIGGKQA